MNCIGIYSNAVHDSSINVNLAGSDISATSLAGTNSFNKIYGNTISKVIAGIVFAGTSTTAWHDQGNDIGGGSSSTANNISFASSSTPLSTAWLGMASMNVPSGIYLSNQTDYSVSNNTVASYTTTKTQVIGIRTEYSAAPSGTRTNAITNNTVTVRSNAGNLTGIQVSASTSAGTITQNISGNTILNGAVGSTTSNFTGISNAFAATTLNMNANILRGNTSVATSGTFTGITNSAAVSGTININGNKIGDASGNAMNFTAGTSGTAFGISNTGGSTNTSLNIQSNDFRSISGVTGAQTYISNSAINQSVNISSNSFTNIVANTGGNAAANITFIANGGVSANSAAMTVAGMSRTISGNSIVGTFSRTASASGTIRFYWTSSANSITGTTETISGNTVQNINVSSSTSPTVNLFDAIEGGSGTGPARVFSNNIISNVQGAGSNVRVLFPTGGSSYNISTNTFSNITGQGLIEAINLLNHGNVDVKKNTITDLTSSGTGGAVSGIIAGIGAANSGLIDSNVVKKLSSTSTSAAVTGISNTTSATMGIYSNTVDTLSGGAVVTGISLSATTTGNVYKNNLFNLKSNSSSTTATQVNGMLFSGGGTVTVHNNRISDLTAPSVNFADAIRGISITSTSTGSFNLYYNTVYLDVTSGPANFGSSALFHTGSTTSTIASLTLKNNIFSNESAPGSSGLTVAFRRSGGSTGVANLNTATNYNSYYAGTPSSSRLLYYDGTNSYQTLATLQPALTPRDANSIEVQPVFENVITKPYNLKLKTTANCAFDGFGTPITGITTDFEEDVRDATMPDIGADEFASTGGGGSPATWKGINTDWNDPANWCGVVPTAATSVIIPSGRPFYPIITNTSPVANAVTISGSANITINAGGKLTFGGHMQNNGTLTNNGQLGLNGTATQDFPGNSGTVSAMDTVVLTKGTSTMNVNKSFTITGALLPTSGTITLNNNNITIASSLAKTARIGAFGNTDAVIYNGSGRFVIERYINTGTGAGQHGKSWQLLATPAKGQTIKNAWQEGNAALGNTVPGYGTLIVSDKPGAVALGFDIQTPGGTGTSMKTYNAAGDNYIAVPNTNSTNIENPNGYMTFVRGDRSVQTSVAAATPVKLRITGKIYNPGAEAPPSVSVLGGLFESVGNPYASAINFANVTRTGGVQDVFYLWDPTLNGAYGLGGWQAFANLGAGYVPTPGGTTMYPSGVPVNIQSGQAFMVKSAGTAGTVSFSEASKTNGSVQQLRNSAVNKTFAVSMFTSAGVLTDGNMAMFDGEYRNTVDEEDIEKLNNGVENLSLMNSSRKLSIERRADVIDTDTLFYSMTNMRRMDYTLKFVPTNMDQTLTAFLVDRFLDTKTQVSVLDTSFVSFTVSDNPASSATDRFYVIFKQLAPVPVTFTQVKAVKEEQDVRVSWKVQNQSGIQRYEIERSSNGTNFTKAGEVMALDNTSDYNWLDENPFAGDNYYRIRSIAVVGGSRISNIAKVRFDINTSITVYPNPVKDDRMVNVKFENKNAGWYEIRVDDEAGKTVIYKKVHHNGGSGNYRLQFSSAHAHGNYIVQVSDASKVKTTFKIVY